MHEASCFLYFGNSLSWERKSPGPDKAQVWAVVPDWHASLAPLGHAFPLCCPSQSPGPWLCSPGLGIRLLPGFSQGLGGWKTSQRFGGPSLPALLPPAGRMCLRGGGEKAWERGAQHGLEGPSCQGMSVLMRAMGNPPLVLIPASQVPRWVLCTWGVVGFSSLS